MKTISAVLLPCILSSLAYSAPAPAAETWFPAEQVQGVLKSAKSLSSPAFGRPGPAAGELAPVRGGRDLDRDSEGPVDFSCGVTGSQCADKRQEKRKPRKLENTPINAGFLAMGDANSTGKIDGPGKQGNGTFKTLKNDPFEMSMEIKTGYIDGIMTLKRDQKTNKDTLRFQGKLWKSGEWAKPVDDTVDIELHYNAKTDEGTISYTENGQDKSEGFWGGKEGKSMTIEFGGGWDHDFYRD